MYTVCRGFHTQPVALFSSIFKYQSITEATDERQATKWLGQEDSKCRKKWQSKQISQNTKKNLCSYTQCVSRLLTSGLLYSSKSRAVGEMAEMVMATEQR